MSLKIDVEEFASDLKLKTVIAGRGDMEIVISDINRPGLQFTGYFHDFVHDRVQVVGNAEMNYLLGLEEPLQILRMREFMGYTIPAVVCARDKIVPKSMFEEAEKNGVPIFVSPLATTTVAHNITSYLDKRLAPVITRHAGLVDVYGVGIMLCGESGIGKSETALELVKRGHRLVADDVLDIKRVTADRLVGSSPEIIRHLMEIRGIGIIDVRHMYGVGSVMQEKTIDIMIELEMWQEHKNYDRVGSEDQFTELLGVKLPVITMPVRPGRNLAIIVEVAARNYLLKRLGYDAAKEFDKRWEKTAREFTLE